GFGVATGGFACRQRQNRANPFATAQGAVAQHLEKRRIEIVACRERLIEEVLDLLQQRIPVGVECVRVGHVVCVVLGLQGVVGDSEGAGSAEGSAGSAASVGAPPSVGASESSPWAASSGASGATGSPLSAPGPSACGPPSTGTPSSEPFAAGSPLSAGGAAGET